MSSLSGVSGSGSNALAAQAAQRSQMQAKMFAKVDTDGSGSVDASELSTMLSEVSKKTGVRFEGTAQELLAKMDSNQDGALGSDELDKGMRALMPPPSTMDFAQARGDAGADSQGDDLFAKLDANGDGSLDTSEVQKLADKIKADTGEDVSDKFAKLDSDGDGKLSRAEFDAGRPEAAAQSAGGAAPAGGAGGPRGAGGAGGAGGGSDSTVYDPLDTNQDGVVSEMERLIGELDNAAKAVGEGKSSTQELAALAKELYEQVASNGTTQDTTSTLSATA